MHRSFAGRCSPLGAKEHAREAVASGIAAFGRCEARTRVTADAEPDAGVQRAIRGRTALFAPCSARPGPGASGSGVSEWRVRALSGVSPEKSAGAGPIPSQASLPGDLRCPDIRRLGLLIARGARGGGRCPRGEPSMALVPKRRRDRGSGARRRASRRRPGARVRASAVTSAGLGTPSRGGAGTRRGGGGHRRGSRARTSRPLTCPGQRCYHRAVGRDPRSSANLVRRFGRVGVVGRRTALVWRGSPDHGKECLA